MFSINATCDIFLLIFDILLRDGVSELIIDLMLTINLFSCSFLSMCMIFLSISDILLIDCVNENTIDLMLSINILSGSFSSICDIFLSISDILLTVLMKIPLISCYL